MSEVATTSEGATAAIPVNVEDASSEGGTTAEERHAEASDEEVYALLKILFSTQQHKNIKF